MISSARALDQLPGPRHSLVVLNAVAEERGVTRDGGRIIEIPAVGGPAKRGAQIGEFDCEPVICFPLPWAIMHKVKAPTLLTWGRDDRVSPLDMALIPMRTIPNAELHVFPNCGHWAQIEEAEEFATVCTDFLAAHKERAKA